MDFSQQRRKLARSVYGQAIMAGVAPGNKKPDFEPKQRSKSGFCLRWRWRESNPRPKNSASKRLQA